MKVAWIVLSGLLALLAVLEVGLRSKFGFGNPLLYLPDDQIGYLLAPNQRIRRYGNRIEINQYSMRGAEIAATPNPQTLRILLLGDSIANGGWWTDQSRILSALLQQEIQSKKNQLQPGQSQHRQFDQVEVLNASANSWGPRNELAYLQRFGSFGAQTIVLLINTDDLFATAPTSLQVGREPSYPDRKPPLAIVEVINRYLVKPAPIPELEAIRQAGGDRVGANLEAIGKIQAIAAQSNAKFLLAMTPLQREVGSPGPHDYELKSRQRLSDFVQQQQIPYIDFLPIFNTASDPAALYQDSIHLSPTGNHLVVQHIAEKLQPSL